MDRTWVTGRSRSRGSGNLCNNFYSQIRKFEEQSCGHYSSSFCFFAVSRKTANPNLRKTNDPDQLKWPYHKYLLLNIYFQRTWERAKLASTLDHVVVATDDENIAECCRGFGADVIMTSESCRNGTERCNEALQKLGKKFDIVVNIQGDEPVIEPEIIDGVVKALQGAPDAVFSTAVTALKPEDGFDPNRVKCIVDNRGYALYFSRGLIPYNKSGKINPEFPYFLHLGIQSYDSNFLRIYPQLPPTPLQLEEDLEQLKVLENGYKMKVIKVDHDAHGVDTPDDVHKIELMMRERNIS
ncbi:hypothetical protein H6P81_020267 [Aristolochia fimbriata]|uniref:3-deoxy-manno-octulosonate cytidylyltransferase n=1 Tax=Aristolochia fimbriata TaxID=158543 RepID=A0AAV7DX78_ARIFI|nr:hypothetical protein H6P81_020267 [Aristolochia fimbriata]